MKKTVVGVLLASLFFCSQGVRAENTFVSQNFEEDTISWASFMPTAKVSITHEKSNVKDGKGALQFDYGVKKAEMNILYYPIDNSALAKATAIKFWLKSNTGSMFIVVLEEKNGGRYNAAFTAPKDQWQKVELSTEDFVLTDSPNDPKDPNGKLDMDQVERIGITDIAQIFVQGGDENLLQLFNISEGARVFYIDTFMATDDTLAKTTKREGDALILDTFARPHIGWMGLGGVGLSRMEGKPLEGAGLEVKYRQAPRKIAAVLKNFPAGQMKDAKQIAFTLVSQNPTTLIVQVEERAGERGGGKYNTTIAVKGGGERNDFVLSLADFKASQDSKDGNDHLDVDLISQVLLIDFTGVTDGSVDRDNTLWLNRLRAIFGK